MLHLYLTALALVTGALVVTGCGSSSKDSTTTVSSAPATTTTAKTVTVSAPAGAVKFASGTPLSRAQWIAQGDVICARTNTKTESSTVKSPQEFARVLPQVALYDKTEATELSKLVPPPSKVDDWKKIVNSLQLYGEYTSRVAEYALAKNEEAAHPLVLQGEKIHKQLAAIAKRDGFKACSLL